MSGGFDARRFKALERSGFNRIAGRYADGAPLRAGLQQALLDLAALRPGEHVLDLAAGPGLLARDAARHVAPGGWVLASDIAEGMLTEGLRRAASEGLTELLATACDAEHLSFTSHSFDVTLLGLGLFIFPEPMLALAEIRRVLKPGGRLALSVWGRRQDVPLIHCAQDCIARLLPAPKVARPSVFRFGDAPALHALLEQAGFSDIRIEPCPVTCHFDSPATYWQAFLDLAGGAAEALSRLPDETRQRLQEAVTDELAPHRRANGYTLESTVLIATGYR